MVGWRRRNWFDIYIYIKSRKIVPLSLGTPESSKVEIDATNLDVDATIV
jgi:hypothetical protein